MIVISFTLLSIALRSPWTRPNKFISPDIEFLLHGDERTHPQNILYHAHK